MLRTSVAMAALASASASEITQIATQTSSSAYAGGFSLPLMGSEGRIVFNGFDTAGTKTLVEALPNNVKKTKVLLSTNTMVPGTSGTFTGYSNTDTSSVSGLNHVQRMQKCHFYFTVKCQNDNWYNSRCKTNTMPSTPTQLPQNYS